MTKFLTAEWRKLILINYAVPPELLQPWLPPGVELDIWNDTCYVSVVGFMFQNVRVKGVPIPFHINFEEVNLRFYVVRKDAELGDKRGAVFISELVPKPAIALVANWLYNEPYSTARMAHSWEQEKDQLTVTYSWRKNGLEHTIGVRAQSMPIPLKVGSEAEFITEHYWGYGTLRNGQTMEYQVEHPRWELYPVESWRCDVNFEAVYGSQFAFLSTAEPVSVFLAEGSKIAVYEGHKI
jgi:uncharacterized protein